MTSLKPTQDALIQLKEALKISKPTDLERDGTIQRFEYCFELTWKLAQRILKDHEIIADSPKSVIRELGQIGWIHNVETWIDFLKSRNETSHQYGRQLAEKSYILAQQFLPLAESLFSSLKAKSNE